MTQVVIDLGEVWADEQTASDAIVNRAAAKLLEGRDLHHELRRGVDATADAVIVEMLRPMIEEAVAMVVQPTDSFGEPKGERTTLREVIIKHVEKELRSTSSRDSLSRPRQTVLEQIIDREVQRVVGEDLREAMDAARKTVREAVQAKGAEVLTDTVLRLARP